MIRPTRSTTALASPLPPIFSRTCRIGLTNSFRGVRCPGGNLPLLRRPLSFSFPVFGDAESCCHSICRIATLSRNAVRAFDRCNDFSASPWSLLAKQSVTARFAPSISFSTSS